jgi:hypothetical protein
MFFILQRRILIGKCFVLCGYKEGLLFFERRVSAFVIKERKSDEEK